MLRRRQFITLVGGAAAWPLAARARQAMPTIGLLHGGTATPVIEAQLAAFRQGLKEGGYIEGQNLAIEYRWGEGKNERLPELAADLVRRNVNVLPLWVDQPRTKQERTRRPQFPWYSTPVQIR
jgi:hypothetical protein